MTMRMTGRPEDLEPEARGRLGGLLHRELEDRPARCGRPGWGARTLVFVPVWREAGDAAAADSALREVAELSLGPREVPLLVVPYLGSGGRQVCADAGASWMDLSGNADVDAPGVRILVKGEPRRFKKAPTRSNLFSPRGSRIAHVFLEEVDGWLTQREVVETTGVDKGLVSRRVRGLLEAELLEGDGARFRPRDPGLLLDAWTEVYEAAGPRAVLEVGPLEGEVERWAARIAGAGYRVVVGGDAAARHHGAELGGLGRETFYMEALPAPEVLEGLGLGVEAPSGVRLVVPRDERGPQVMAVRGGGSGLEIASSTFTYLDLDREHRPALREVLEARWKSRSITTTKI